MGNRCTDAEGHEIGHAGCTINFNRYWSSVLDPYMLEFGTNRGNILVGGKDAWECRESSAYEVIATCSTAKRFVVVERGQTAPLTASVWTGDALAPTQFAADVDRAASGDQRWTLRFAAHVLSFARQGPAATLDGEPCVAFRLGRLP